MKLVSEEEFGDMFDQVIDGMKSIGPGLDDEFKKLFCRVFHFLRGYADINGMPDLTKKARLRGWVRRTHRGWKYAIKIITENLIVLLNKKVDIEKQISELRIKKDLIGKEKAILEKRRINLKILVLRRCMDHIAWTILEGEYSSIRRLSLKGAESNFSLKNILSSQEAVEMLNSSEYRIALPSDVTTFIHIGDIFSFNFETGVVEFIELKSGKKNIEMVNAVDRCKTDLEFEKGFLSSLSKTDLGHFNRLKKQNNHTSNVLENLKSGKGIDNYTGGKVHVTETPEAPKKFCLDILALREKLQEKDWAINIVDDCVYLGMYRELSGETVAAFCGWVAAFGCSAKAVNITESFMYGQATPFTAIDLKPELLKEMFLGEVHVLMCLDLKRLIKRIQEFHGDVIFLRNPSRRIGKLLNVEDLLIDGKEIWLRSKGGEFRLGTGILDRVYFGLESPFHFVTQLLKYSELTVVE